MRPHAPQQNDRTTIRDQMKATEILRRYGLDTEEVRPYKKTKKPKWIKVKLVSDFHGLDGNSWHRMFRSIIKKMNRKNT